MEFFGEDISALTKMFLLDKTWNFIQVAVYYGDKKVGIYI